jgi:hypothetical protein
MNPLTIDDLVPLPEFTARRAEFFDAHRRYLDRYRRVRLGPDVSLIFENRQTIWFKVQEILRIARLSDAVRVQRELDWYNGLLPGQFCLRASLVVDGENEELVNAPVRLAIGREQIEAAFVTSRPEDLCVGGAQMLEFTVPPELRALLLDGAVSTSCEIAAKGYKHSTPLSGSVRQSLADDLAVGEREAA